MPLATIHPFPARMAPEVAREALDSVLPGGRVIDPMCGSGTVARAAVEAGLRCVASDVDPLAVLMARVWTRRISATDLASGARALVSEAQALAPSAIERGRDVETQRFVAYWFADAQEDQLARLSTVLRQQTGPIKDALCLALSRIIVSKGMLASLARDTSHSRPHRVAVSNEFDVYSGFARASRYLATRLQPSRITGEAEVQCDDARTLVGWQDGTFDLAVTSPPYLNAIDYIRGHRLALVWLGYEVALLREIRATSVGAERGLDDSVAGCGVEPFVALQAGARMEPRHLGWIRRYAADMRRVLTQLRRVVRKDGGVVLVVGNSFLRGAIVDNAGLVASLAADLGLQITDRSVREIPARRRYLPPPGSGNGALDARLRAETVLSFCV